MDIFGTPPRTDNLSDLGLKKSQKYIGIFLHQLLQVRFKKVWVVSQAQVL